MNKLGDIKSSKELDYKTNHNQYIWASCEICHKERWVQLLKGKPQWSHCIECGKNIRKHNKSYTFTDKEKQLRQSRIEQLKRDGIECKRCKKILPATLDYFPVEHNSKLGLKKICKPCYNTQACERNLEQGKIKYHRQPMTKKERRVSETMSIGIRRAIHLGKQGRHWEDLVGYTLKDLMRHIEKQFTSGMSWNNYGTLQLNNNPPKWHIDHIIPKSVFNLESPDSPDVKRCWALSNLRPLWGIENSSKGSRLIKPYQPSLDSINLI